MEKLHFKTTIKAPKEKVWNVLWDIESYKKWTKAFSESSNVETDGWKEGSKVIFGDGNGCGMIAKVAANKPNEFMSFKHLGQIDNGVEDTTSDKVKDWAGAMENYTLKETNGETELLVDMDISPEFKDMFSQMWPKALESVKELAEAKGKTITVEVTVNAPVEKVWASMNDPKHITQWCFASDDWHAPKSENDVRAGGQLKTTMAAKDGNFSFDFLATYTKVEDYKTIEYVIADGRQVKVDFEKISDKQTKVIETFEMENTHPEEMQRGGWQAILTNFKKHTESLA